jgi:Arc/MetJ-type ribon-helix-helix transcriptional regulator
MKSNAKSSITLPASELKQVERLQRKLGARSKVEVVRRGLQLLTEQLDRNLIRDAYRDAANRVRGLQAAEMDVLDHLTSKGLDD